MGGKLTGNKRWPAEMAQDVATAVLTRLAPVVDEAWVCGSLRRGKPDVGDVDLVVVPRDRAAFDCLMIEMFGLQKNGKPAHSGVVDGMQVDIGVATQTSFGAHVLFLTGSWEHNVVMRSKAKKLGMMLNEKGLFKATLDAKGKPVAGEWLAGVTEKSVFDALGMEYLEPKDREVAGFKKTAI